LRDLAARAGTVLVGLDEAADLWGCTSADDVRDLFPANELVVKDASRAAIAFHPGGRVEVSALDVVVVEPVGAGDAFAAGYLSVRVSGGDVAQALRTGHAVASTALVASDDHGEPADPALLRLAATGEGWPDSLHSRGTR
jgi:2-dehydro-3-deoxygluconokinase